MRKVSQLSILRVCIEKWQFDWLILLKYFLSLCDMVQIVYARWLVSILTIKIQSSLIATESLSSNRVSFTTDRPILLVLTEELNTCKPRYMCYTHFWNQVFSVNIIGSSSTLQTWIEKTIEQLPSPYPFSLCDWWSVFIFKMHQNTIARLHIHSRICFVGGTKWQTI